MHWILQNPIKDLIQIQNKWIRIKIYIYFNYIKFI